jgi:hypothetical protein
VLLTGHPYKESDMQVGKYEVKTLVKGTNDLKLVGYFGFKGRLSLAKEVSEWLEDRGILVEGGALSYSVSEDWAFTLHATDDTLYLFELVE